MEKGEKKNSFYKYLMYFLVFSFLGWLFETLAVYAMSGQWTARGYFFIGPRLAQVFETHSFVPLETMNIFGLPAIEMYGVGGLLLVVLLMKHKDNIIKVFFLGSIYMSIFELLGSYWCDMILHHSYWNYNHELLNFQGRICLQSSLAWGVLGLLVIYLLEPLLEKEYLTFKQKKYYKQTLIIFGIMMLCCALAKYVFYDNIMPN